MSGSWRERAGTTFDCSKRPAIGSWGMAVTNHPLASAAAIEVMAHGGNAVDAATAALFTLCVVEPMMVGLLGGGTSHIRTPDGRHLVLDGLGVAPAAARAAMYEPLPVAKFSFTQVKDRRNTIGAAAVAVPGTLAALCEAASRFGRLPLADLIDPAIRLAANGFVVTPYLASSIARGAPDIASDKHLAHLLIPHGRPLQAGERLQQGTLAESLRVIAREGARALSEGSVGSAFAEHIARSNGRLTQQDLRDYRVVERAAIRGIYRQHEIFGPPPPVSSGVHIVQMLNILEGYDIARLGFGTPQALHLIVEALKIAFADRSAVTADPAFVRVPIDQLTAKTYGDERRAQIDLRRARSWAPGVVTNEVTNTTHVTVADRDGWVVAATHTIGGLFGANLMVPELGLIANNYMRDFDPRPGHAQSIAPGKRVTSSQAPMIVVKDGRPVFALGLPGGLRIFGCALQSLLNLIDHGMSLQEAVEAPRVWCGGNEVEIENGMSQAAVTGLRELGHEVLTTERIANGMNAIAFRGDDLIEGAACWRADGTPAGLGGGLARAGISA